MQIYEKITKNYILQRIPQETIFEYYTNIKVCDDNFEANAFYSPFRKDNNPTCNYYYSGEYPNIKLRMKDWNGSFKGDCFDAAAKRTNININNSKGFNLLLEKIAFDFKINKYTDEQHQIEFKTSYTNYIKSKRLVFKVVPRKFNIYDKHYWYDTHCISSDILKLGRVIPIQELHIEGKDGYLHLVYTYNYKNPGYAYLGKTVNNITEWITYFPFEQKKYKHRRNANFVLGYNLFIPARIGIITKSYKDALAFKAFGISAVAIPAETYLMKQDEIIHLKSKVDILFTNFDYDRAGISLANKYKKIYNIYPIMLNNKKNDILNVGVKDFSAFIATYKKDKTINLLSFLYEKYKDLFYATSYNNYKLFNIPDYAYN